MSQISEQPTERHQLPAQRVHACPDDTYFRTSDVMPRFDEDGLLHVYDGRGTYRSWGSPSVTSTVSWLSTDVLLVEVVGWHKHTVSPVGGSYYFVREGEDLVRRRASAKAVKAALAAVRLARGEKDDGG